MSVWLYCKMHVFCARSELTTCMYVRVSPLAKQHNRCVPFGKKPPNPDGRKLQRTAPNFYQDYVKFFRCTWEIIVAPLSSCNDFVFHIESRQHFDINCIFENVLFFEMQFVYERGYSAVQLYISC